jgi:hypothetical protein
MKHALKLLAAFLAIGGIQAAQAAPMEFTATLSGANESPPNASPGTGLADVFVDPIAHTLRVIVTFSGLTSGDTASHIHCCTPGVQTGTAGVATITPTFTGFPPSVTSGFYDHTFDLTSATAYNPAFVSLNGTLGGAEAALIGGMLTGESYLNIHTTNFPGGEIRGFLVYVPEPVTLSVFGAGLVGAAFLRRRGKRRA